MPTNSSRPSPARSRNGARIGPCIPVSPPKNPESTPPTGRAPGPNASRWYHGTSSSAANTASIAETMILAIVTLARTPPSVYSASGAAGAMSASIAAPTIAATTAGTPKRSTTPRLASVPTSAILKRLFTRCTTAVAAIATSIGKNRAKTGMSTVPSPKPLKNVIAATKAARIGRIRRSTPRV